MKKAKKTQWSKSDLATWEEIRVFLANRAASSKEETIKELPKSMVEPVTYTNDGEYEARRVVREDNEYEDFVALGCKEEDIDALKQAVERPELIEEEASRVVRGGEREAVYGHPGEDFRRTAKMWSAILGAPVTPEEVALCMIALKISRLVKTPGHRDSLVDTIGYSICYDRLRERKLIAKVKEFEAEPDK